ncbi:MAG TPA: ABC transporter permease [Bryobacteraceae bacterium]|nr:ABC transporter permease [Bryobacteraceae bacterium]
MATGLQEPRTAVPAIQPAAATGSMLAEILWIAGRSLRKITRNPTILFFSLMTPVIWLVLFSQMFARLFARGAAGGLAIPYDYVAVMLPGVTTMTAIQSASQSGFGMVADIESGFMDKFFVSPIQRSSVLMGKLVADGFRMAVQAAVILLLAFVLRLIAGWRIPFATGIPGALVVVVLTALFGVAFSGLSNAVALRTKNTEATMMVSFSLTMPLLFVSTAMLPKMLLPDWLQKFAAFNPVSYLADISRDLILTGYNWPELGKAVLAIVILGGVLNGFAVAAFRAQGK